MQDRADQSGSNDAFPAELLIWLTPTFPIGSFAYSQGLETAVARGWVSDAETLTAWLTALARHGSLRNDLIILSLVHRASADAAVGDLAELAAAMQPSKERAEEALVQGQAFLDAYHAAWAERGDPFSPVEGPITLPVAVGQAARARSLPLQATLIAYATAFTTNLVFVAIRLGAIGQFDGQRVLAALLPELRETCRLALNATEDDLGGAAFAADLASILHETQTTRLFRS